MLAYRCRHSGLYFPESYFKEWGKTTGIGMGPRPVSEVLDTLDNEGVSKSLNHGPMLPVGVTHAELDLVQVTPDEFEARKAILASDDPDMAKRVPLIITKQKAKRIATAQAAFTLATEGE